MFKSNFLINFFELNLEGHIVSILLTGETIAVQSLYIILNQHQAQILCKTPQLQLMHGELRMSEIYVLY